MFSPKYTITDKILKNIAEISEIRNLVQSARILPEREAFLRKVATAKIAHSSTSIEGNTLLPHEVNAVQEGKKITAEKGQILEVSNYLKALKKIDEICELKIDIDVNVILNLHRIVMNGLIEPKKVGHFRKNQVYIVNISKGIEEVVYTPPASKDVETEIKNLLNWLKNNDAHPIIKTALFHYQFETIHPFTDGNGRTGRLLSLLYLYQSGFKFKKILVLEDYYNSNRRRYYEGLQTGKSFSSRKKCDLSSWIEYYTDGFLHEVLNVKDQILSLKGLKNSDKEIKFLDKDEIKIIDFVLSLGKITSDDVCDILSIPKRTAQNKLKNMVDKKIITKKGLGPTTFYIAS